MLVLTAAPGEEMVTRFGFAVSKRVGKAHVRNRVRRLLRESIRAHLPEIAPGFDVVISGRPAIAGQPFAVVEAAVQRQLRQAHLLLSVVAVP